MLAAMMPSWTSKLLCVSWALVGDCGSNHSRQNQLSMPPSVCHLLAMVAMVGNGRRTSIIVFGY